MSEATDRIEPTAASMTVEVISRLCGAGAHELLGVFANIRFLVDSLRTEPESGADRVELDQTLAYLDSLASRGRWVTQALMSLRRVAAAEPVVINVRHLLVELQSFGRATLPTALIETDFPENLWHAYAPLPEAFVALFEACCRLSKQASSIRIRAENNIGDSDDSTPPEQWVLVTICTDQDEVAPTTSDSTEVGVPEQLTESETAALLEFRLPAVTDLSELR